jgi:adenylate cyclase
MIDESARAVGAPSLPMGTRHYAAVAFADIVGYTILTATDGERTQARWMTLLWGTLQPLARKHGATIVKSTGDGVLADFPSASAAFAWAQEVQEATREDFNGTLPPIVFRIAIHVGEMHYTDEGVYGEAVNIAARLQGHAPPGGVAFSEAARTELPAPPPMDDLGMLSLRNIPAPVRAFALHPSVPVRVPHRAPPSDMPSIAVLPFELVAGDETDRYLANGIIEDIVVSLGALRDLAVIARSATVGWSGATRDARIVGRMLGVRYVLGGTIRRAPGRLRMTLDLREAEEGDSLWSDRLDVAAAELFEAQDEIVARVVDGIAPGIRAAELRRALRKRPENLTAYDLTLRAMYTLDSLQRETFGTAGDQLRQAIAEDPAFAVPVAWSAQWHSLAVGQSWSTRPIEDAAAVGQMATHAVQLDPRNALGHAMRGHHRAYHQRDPASALPYFDRALAACPSHALASTLKSASLSYLGRGPEALEAAEKGFRLSPHGPDRYYFQFFVGLAHYACGNFSDAARWTQLSLADNPGFSSAHKALMASLVALGRKDEAAAVARQMLALEPDFRLDRYANERVPIVDPALRKHLIDHMRLAGLPD